MALPHLPPGDIAPLALPAQALTQTASHALFKTAGMQVMRIVLPKGHALPEHSAPGPITMQCLQGALQVQAGGVTRTLYAGELMWLAPAAPHVVQALQDASLLVTLCLP